MCNYGLKKTLSYQSSFTEDFDYIMPLSVKGSLYAKCTACCSDFTISHGGRADVVKQVATQKYIDNVKCVIKN